MHYLQTLVTTLQAVMHISQPHAFLYVTETVARPSLPRAGDAIHPDSGREWSGTRDYVIPCMHTSQRVKGCHKNTGSLAWDDGGFFSTLRLSFRE